jgi:Spy/CpxP family protein refolding chaperone
MTRRAYLYFTLTIVLGAVLGGAGVYYYLWHSGRLQHPGGFNKARAEAHLKKDLNLSADQMQLLDQIFDEGSKRIDDLQRQTDPQFQAIHMETRARIRQILNPEQAKKFDELVKEMDERRKRHGPPPPPPPR